MNRFNRPLWLAVLLACGHLAWLLAFVQPAIAVPDAHDHFAQARLLVTDGHPWLVPGSDVQFVDPRWSATPEGGWSGSRPPGIVLLLALPMAVAGPLGAAWLMPALSSMSVLAVFLLGRRWMGDAGGLIAAALVAVYPMNGALALSGDPNAAVTCLLLGALLAIGRWHDSHSFAWAFVAGALAGLLPSLDRLAVWYLPAFIVFFLLHVRRDRRWWWVVFGSAAGLIVPLGALLVHNQVVHGALWPLGGPPAGGAGSSWSGRAGGLIPAGWTLFTRGCLFAVPLGLAGAATLLARPSTRRSGLFLVLLIVPVSLASVLVPPESGPQPPAALLATFPLYTLAGVWWLWRLTDGRAAVRRAATVLLLAVTAVWGLAISMPALSAVSRQQALLADITRMVDRHVAPGSVIVSGLAVNQQLDVAGRWLLADASLVRPSPAIEVPEARARRDTTATGRASGRFRRMPAEQRFLAFSDALWRWAGPNRGVYLLLDATELRPYYRRVPAGSTFTLVDHLTLPDGFLRVSESPRLPPAPVPSPWPGVAVPEPWPLGPPDISRLASVPEPDRLVDLVFDGRPLYLVRWTRGARRQD